MSSLADKLEAEFAGTPVCHLFALTAGLPTTQTLRFCDERGGGEIAGTFYEINCPACLARLKAEGIDERDLRAAEAADLLTSDDSPTPVKQKARRGRIPTPNQGNLTWPRKNKTL